MNPPNLSVEFRPADFAVAREAQQRAIVTAKILEATLEETYGDSAKFSRDNVVELHSPQARPVSNVQVSTEIAS